MAENVAELKVRILLETLSKGGLRLPQIEHLTKDMKDTESVVASASKTTENFASDLDESGKKAKLLSTEVVKYSTVLDKSGQIAKIVTDKTEILANGEKHLLKTIQDNSKAIKEKLKLTNISSAAISSAMKGEQKVTQYLRAEHDKLSKAYKTGTEGRIKEQEKARRAIESSEKKIAGAHYRSRLELERVGRQISRMGLQIVGAYALMIRESVKFGIETARLSAVTGESISKIAKLSAVAAGFGIDAKAFIKSVGGLSQALLTAGEGTSLIAKRVREVLATAGLQAERFRGHHMPVLETLDLVRKAYQNLGSQMDKAYLAQRLFGENAETMMPYLEASDKTIKRLNDTIGILPSVTRNSIQAMMDFNVTLNTLRMLLRTIGVQITESLGPMFDKLRDLTLQLSYVVKGVGEKTISFFASLTLKIAALAIGLGALLPIFVNLNRIFVATNWIGSALAAKLTVITGGLILVAGAIALLASKHIALRGEMKAATEQAEELADTIDTIEWMPANEHLKQQIIDLTDDVRGLKKESPVVIDIKLGLASISEKLRALLKGIAIALTPELTKALMADVERFQERIIELMKKGPELTARQNDELQREKENLLATLETIYTKTGAAVKYRAFEIKAAKELRDFAVQASILRREELPTVDDLIKKVEELGKVEKSTFAERIAMLQKPLDIYLKQEDLRAKIGQATDKDKKKLLQDQLRELVNQEKYQVLKGDELKIQSEINQLEKEGEAIIESYETWTRKWQTAVYEVHPALSKTVDFLKDAAYQIKKLTRHGKAGAEIEKVSALARTVTAKNLAIAEREADDEVLAAKIKNLEKETKITEEQSKTLEGYYKKRAQREKDVSLKMLEDTEDALFAACVDELIGKEEFDKAVLVLKNLRVAEEKAIEMGLTTDLEGIGEKRLKVVESQANRELKNFKKIKIVKMQDVEDFVKFQEDKLEEILKIKTLSDEEREAASVNANRNITDVFEYYAKQRMKLAKNEGKDAQEALNEWKENLLKIVKDPELIEAIENLYKSLHLDRTKQEELNASWSGWLRNLNKTFGDFGEAAEHLVSGIVDGFVSAFKNLILTGESFGKAMREIFRNLFADIAAMLLKSGLIKMLIHFGMPSSLFGISPTPVPAPGKAKGGLIPAPTYAPPTLMMAEGGLTPVQRFQQGGDVVPAMLTPGELVLPKSMTDWLRGALKVPSVSSQEKKEELKSPTFLVNINAVDAISFSELARRNPEAITSVVSERMMHNEEIRAIMKEFIH